MRVEVDAFLDAASVRQLEDTITKAIGKGFEKAFNNQAQWKRIFQTVSQGFAQAQKQQQSTTASSQAGFTKMEDAAKAYILELQRLGIAISNISAATNRVTTEERNAQIKAREQYLANQRARTQAADANAKRLAQIARTQGELEVNAAKTASKQRVQITRFTLETIARLERGAGRAVVGIARTTTSAIGTMYQSLGRVMRRNNSAINDGLGSSLRSREVQMRGSFSRQEAIIAQSAAKQRALQQSISTGVLGAATGRGVGPGLGIAAGGVGIGALLSAGFTRFSELERLNKQFLALTGNIESANMLMEQVKQFAKETPFDLVGVADLAKGFIAIKTPLDEVLNRVKIFADAVALTGGNADSLNRIQRAIGQVVSAGRLQGDELNQLAENLPGLNIRQILADQLTGGNVRALVEMQEAGELSADMFVNGLVTGLGSDPRLVGASGDLAKTLSGRVGNLKESFADFGAAIIGTIAGPLKVAITGTQLALQQMADFIKGEDLGPALTLLREGLKGVALGMGAVIAAKGAVEVVGLLGKTLSLFLSPMGIVLLTVGLIGGAISILTSRSEALRITLRGLGERFSEVGDEIRDRLRPLVEGFGNFLDDTLIPAIDRVARFLADNLLVALDATISFITDFALPALGRLAVLVGEILGPALAFVGEKASQFWKIVQPLLRPAIDGFRDLGAAIGSAISGDFSGIGSGAASALSGIGATVAGIALAVGKALLPVGERLVHFFTDLFSGPNLAKYLGFALSFVEQLGEVLGRIVTSPFLVKAVAGIAAAAALLAVTFVKGFVTGVVKNLPDLLGLIGDALTAGLKLAFNNIGTVILGGLAITALLPRITSLFRKTGEAAGTGFLSGMQSKVKGAGGFLSGFLGKPGTVAATTKKALQVEIAAINREMVALGSKPITQLRFGISEKSVAAARAALIKVQEGFTSAERAGRLARTSATEFGVAFRGVFAGLGAAVGGAMKLSGTQITTGLRGAFASVQTFVAQQGTTIGKALGGALRSGAQVGLSAFIGGKAAGESGGSSLFAALTAGVTGLAVGGPLIGAASAGVSLIATAFGSASKAAKDFVEAVKTTASALREELKTAVEAGKVTLSELQRGLLDIGDVSGFDAIKSAFTQELGDDGVATFARLGLTWRKDILPILEAGGDLDTLKNKLKTTFIEGATASSEFTRTFGSNADSVARFVKDAVASGQSANKFIDRVEEQIIDGLGDRTRNAILDNEAFVRDLINTSGDLTRAAGITTVALENINNAAKFDPADPSPIVGSIDTVERRLGDLGVVISGIDAQLNELFNPGDTALQQALDNAAIVAAGLGQQRGGLDPASVTFDASARNISRQISAQITEAFRVGVNEGAIFDAQSAKDVVKPVIDAYVAGFADPVAAADARRSLEAALVGASFSIDNIKVSEAAKAQLNDIIARGFGDVALTPGTETAIQAFDLTLADVQEYVRTHPVLAELSIQEQAAATVAARFVQDLQQFMRDEHATLAQTATDTGDAIGRGLELGLYGREDEVAAAAARLGRAATAAMNRNLQISSPSRVFMRIGRQIGDGLALGIKNSTSTVVGAMDDVFDRVASIASQIKESAAAALPNPFGSSDVLNDPLGLNRDNNYAVDPSTLGLELNSATGRWGFPFRSSTMPSSSTQSTTFNNTIVVPTGDPQAVALAVTNAQASTLFRK